jgi:hypothetical protein
LGPFCALGDGELSRQLARYRSVGRGVEWLERKPLRPAVRVGPSVPDSMIDELIVAVAGADHEPAREAIAAALEPA